MTTTFGAETDIAATTLPSAPRIGAATQLMDSSWPPRSVAQPCSRTRSNSFRKAGALGVERDVYMGYSSLSARVRRSVSWRSARSSLATAATVMATGLPIREYIRTG